MIRFLAYLLVLVATPVLGQSENTVKTIVDAGASARGALVETGADMLILGGTVGIDADGNVPATFEEQLEQTFRNVAATLAEAGMTPMDLASLTIYVVESQEAIEQAYVSQIFGIHDRVLGETQRVGAAVYVSALARPEFLVEVQGIAVRRTAE